MPSRYVLVSGSLAYDRIMDFPGRFADHILPGKVHVLNVSFAVTDFTEHRGGTAGNIAYTLALLGLRPVVIGAVGADFAPYRSWLTRCRVSGAGIRVVSGERTASAHIITDANDCQITGFHLGAMRHRGLPPSARLLGQSALAVVAPGNAADMERLPERYRRARLPYLFDPGQQLTSLRASAIRSAVQGACGVVVNDYELALLRRKTGWTLPQVLRRTPLLVTTLGPKGSILRQGRGVVRAPAAKPRAVIDPTGAGDAYRAGLIFGLLRGWPLATVGRFAGLVAVYTVERAGTQTHRFTRADLRRRYRENFGRDLPLG